MLFHPLHILQYNMQANTLGVISSTIGGDGESQRCCNTRHTLRFQTDIVLDYDYRMIRLLLIKIRSCG